MNRVGGTSGTTARSRTLGGTHWVSLHTHSTHSTRDGLSFVDDLARAAALDGQPAIAVTDHGTLSSAWKLGRAARANGIKPIVGMEAYLAVGDRHRQAYEYVPRDIFDADGGGSDGVERGSDPGANRVKKRSYEHLTLLAATAEGYRNLSQLSSKAADSFYEKPRIDYDLLREHHKGLIILTGCVSGPVSGALALDGRAATREMYETNKNFAFTGVKLDADGAFVSGLIDGKSMAKSNLRRLIDVFEGESADYIRDHLYVEVMEHGIPVEQAVTRRLFGLARWSRRLLADLDDRDGTDNLPLRVVATNDSHFTRASDHDAHDIWLCIGSSDSKRTFKVTDPDRYHFTGDGYHLRTHAEMVEAFAPYGDEGLAAIHEAARIADLVDEDVLPESRIRLPEFPTPEGFADSRAYIRHLIDQGARERYGEDWRTARPDVKGRLNHELRVISRLGFIDYFLIVHDMITWARGAGIRVGPGRGSAAGSVVSYCLGIVQIDPIANKLLFERFLDDTREEMPDIDTDFEKAHQAEVFSYLTERWGAENVARLGTFGFSRAKQSIKNAARVTLPASRVGVVGNALAKLVPDKATLTDISDPSFEPGALLREKLTDPEMAGLFASARKIEGVISAEGIHACGAVISTEPLAPMVPLRRDRKEADRAEAEGRAATWVTQFDGHDVADIGLLKVDVLGLRNLDVISEAVRQIRAVDPSEFAQSFDPEHPPFDADDPRVRRTWAMLSSGSTSGVFQLESSGMTRLAEQVRPSSIEDLSALVALYRPGPLSAGFPDMYARRKNGDEPVDYSIFTDDAGEQQVLAEVLGNTYGLIVYQEQMMQLGTAVAGFGPAENNRLRRAVSKKKHDEMVAVGKLFVDGAQKASDIKPAFARSTAEALWDGMKGAGEYCFNKSHSAAYGHVAYMTAFLKANWPAQYGAALLACTSDDDKRSAILRSLRADGIAVAPPSVTDGRATAWAGADGVIRLGLAEIKGVSAAAAESLVRARDTLRGAPRCLTDLFDAGAVQSDGASRKLNVAQVKALIESGACDSFGPRKGLMMTVGAAKGVRIAPVDAEFGPLERARRERRCLGVLLSENPLVTLRDQIRRWRTPDGIKPIPVHKLPDRDGTTVVTLGVLAQFEERTYHQGRMANLTVEGTGASLSGPMFNSVMTRLEREGNLPRVGDIVAVRGKLRTSEVRVSEREDDDWGDEDDEDVVVETRREIIVNDIYIVPTASEDTLSLPGDAQPVLRLLRGGLSERRHAPGHATTPEPISSAPKASSTPARGRPMYLIHLPKGSTLQGALPVYSPQLKCLFPDLSDTVPARLRTEPGLDVASRDVGWVSPVLPDSGGGNMFAQVVIAPPGTVGRVEMVTWPEAPGAAADEMREAS